MHPHLWSSTKMAAGLCTELILCTVAEGVNILEPSTPAGAAFTHFATTLRGLSPVKHAYVGPRVEDVTKIVVVIGKTPLPDTFP